MGEEHKAFVFDYDAFEVELGPLLFESLSTADVSKLEAFVDLQIDVLVDPYEGEALDSNWREMLEVVDCHQCGDFALTKYYSPKEDVGLGYGWEYLQEEFERLIPGMLSPVLGNSWGPPLNLFDPGKLGSYFQAPGLVARNRGLISGIVKENSSLVAVEEMLSLPFRWNRGLYITF